MLSLLRPAAMAEALPTKLTAKKAVLVPPLRVVLMHHREEAQAVEVQMPSHLPRKRSMEKAESGATAVVALVVRAAAFHRTGLRKAQA